MEWRATTLGEVCDQVAGVIQTGPFGSQLHESDYSEDGTPVVMPKDIIEGRINTDSVARVAAEHVERLARHNLKAGDIVYGRRGDIGRQALIRREQEGWLCGTGCLRLSLGDSVLDPLFLHYYLRQESVISWIANQAVGATMANLNTGILRSVPVHCPPLAAQRRIAGILSAYDDLIENSQRRIQILEEMARALYREWFVEFRFPGHEKVPLVTSSLGGNPQGWQAISFENLLLSMTGGDWGSDQPTEDESSEVGIVRGTDFEEVAYGGHLRVPVRYIKPSSLKSRALREGDVIVENSVNAKSRCIGTPLLVDKHVLGRLGRDSVAASFCKVFRFREPSLAPVAHLHLRHLREEKRMEYYQNVASNGIGNFQAQRFSKEEHVVLPSNSAARSELVGRIAVLTERVSLLASQIQNLRQTRDLLLPRLLSGQVALIDTAA